MKQSRSQISATFTYRAVNPAGDGNVATVTITVAAPTSPLPPTGLQASSIVGNVVTLRWTPPTAGLPPTSFALEGGVNPGQVLASIDMGSTSPVFTFTAPTGAFYLRIHTLAGANKSTASNEIQIFVNVPTAPSAPANLLGLVDGASLSLAWRNTYGGGAPTGLLLDVSGSASVSVPLSLTESFTLAGVPGGSYTFSLRATSPAGVSSPSNAVSLTFPGWVFRSAAGAGKLPRDEDRQPDHRAVGFAIERPGSHGLRPQRHRVIRGRLPNDTPLLISGGGFGVVHLHGRRDKLLWRWAGNSTANSGHSLIRSKSRKAAGR